MGTREGEGTTKLTGIALAVAPSMTLERTLLSPPRKRQNINWDSRGLGNRFKATYEGGLKKEEEGGKNNRELKGGRS